MPNMASRLPYMESPRIRTGFAQRFDEALDGEGSEAFARRINVPLRAVQRWRSGEAEPRAATLIVIAVALGRDPSWFFNGDKAAA